MLSLATGVHAQTLPVPEVPSEETEPTDPTQPADVPAQKRPRPPAWDYEAGVGGTWDSNIGFVQAEGDDGVAVIPRASLSRVFWNPRGEMTLRASGRWVGYPDQSDRSRAYGSFGLDGGYRSSPRTSWRFGASYDLGYTDSSQVLQNQGVQLAVSETSTLAADLGLVRRLGARTSLRVGGRFFRTEFESPELFDGSSLRGTLSLEQGLGERSTGALVYSLENVMGGEAGDAYFTHYGSLQWTRVVTRRTALLLEAGVGFTPDAARAGLDRETSFFGGASLTREVGRSSLSLFVRHEVTPAFGTGVSRPQLRAGVGLDVPLGQKWEFRLGGTYVAAQEPDSPGGYPHSSDASGALVFRVARALAVSAESAYRRRGSSFGTPAIDGVSAGLYLTVRRPGPRVPRSPGRR